ncbi:MAG TPA: acyltransferase [Pedobacter sp.]|jgi:fucose 4-O-acetylase-like acetyltransferase
MPKPAYSFVDNIRCIAILAIVVEHISLDPHTFRPSDKPYWIFLTITQLFKFGTIAFFLIAGFLFAENKDGYGVIEYLKRRFNNIFRPWLIWSLTFVILVTAAPTLNAIIINAPLKAVVSNIWWGGKWVYLHSNYWFIMNFFFCTTVLLLNKKSLNSWSFGFILFSLTMFYSVNMYYEWIVPEHTTAIFGFIFFYWLGIQLNRFYAPIKNFIEKTSIVFFVLATILTLFISVQESSFLYSMKKIEHTNTLRFSNIVFSITIFFMFLKIGNFNWLAFLQPRKTTYGIYLIHYIFAICLLPLIFGNVDKSVTQQYSILEMLQYEISRFLIVYVLSFTVVQLISRSKFAWAIGSNPLKKPANQHVKDALEVDLGLKTEAA